MKQRFTIIFCLLTLISYAQLTPGMKPGKAETYYYGEQDISTYFDGEKYYLRDDERKIKVINLNGGDHYSSDVPISSESNNWGEKSFLEDLVITIDNSFWESVRSSQFDKPEIYAVIYDSNNNEIIRTNIYEKNNLNPEFLYNYYIPDTTVKIEVYDSNFFPSDKLLTTFNLPYIISNNEQTFTDNNGNNLKTTIRKEKNPVLDIYWGMQNTYNYFKEIHGRNSFDGNGGYLHAVINTSSANEIYGNRNNAYAKADWVKPAILGFGLGDKCLSKPWVEQDIVSHEYMHAIINTQIASLLPIPRHILEYQGESGAINESLADMFGELVENYTKRKFKENNIEVNVTKWEVTSNQNFGRRSVRSMQNPSADDLIRTKNCDSNEEKLDHRSPKYYNHNPEKSFSRKFWQDVNHKYDKGFVHVNSGVGNFWFYLLTDQNNGNPNTGTNIVGNTYSVNAIGFDKIGKILYEVVTNGYLRNKSGYEDFADATVKVAVNFFIESKYNITIDDILAIREAWFAVGVLPNQNQFCDNLIVNNIAGTLDDGSLNEQYRDNQNCTWQISPVGAEKVLLKFKYINLAEGDFLKIHDGVDASAPILREISNADNNVYPLEINSTTSAVFLNFTTDESQVADGWDLEFEGINGTSNCNSHSFVYLANGKLEDGSGTNNYTNNNACSWTISPENATYIEIDFTLLDLENNKDFVKIYSGTGTTTNPIVTYTGNQLPLKLTIPSSAVYIEFTSDYRNNAQGWQFNFSSDGIQPCFENVTITDASGTVSDGSSANNYGNNANCSWLIKPENATSITIDFDELNLQPRTDYTNSDTDYLAIYDAEFADPDKLISKFTGINYLPIRVESSGGAVFVKFVSDNSITDKGWQFRYTSSAEDKCSGTTLLKDVSGNFEVGKNGNYYTSNSDCRWLIKPDNALSIELSFTEFETESSKDGVVIYDGPNTTYPYKVYSGNDIPEKFYSTNSQILVRFISDDQNNFKGFKANYKANISNNNNTNSLRKNEYWFNDNYENRTQVVNKAFANSSQINQEIDISNLENGLNTFHFRTQDSNGSWSSILSEYIYIQKVKKANGSKITNYEYWYDDDFNNKKLIAITPSANITINLGLETENLEKGLHTLHLRFQDSKQTWSSVISEYFIKTSTNELGVNKISGYRYWFNDNFETVTILNVELQEKLLLVKELEISDLPQDSENFIHFQFKDTFGNWSSVLTEKFTYNKTLNSDDFLKDEYNVYPNPTTDIINIKSPDSRGLFKVYNPLGQLIITKKTIPNSVDLSSFSSGIFIIRIELEDKIIQTKVIKK